MRLATVTMSIFKFIERIALIPPIWRMSWVLLASAILQLLFITMVLRLMTAASTASDRNSARLAIVYLYSSGKILSIGLRQSH
ncbi:MAG: hypothetical protein EBU30_08590 [Synechococcaceae bacterium WB6_3B_236]|nr:hypothetical protein [Synechococcaceae bacterium WB6_3B_236]